MHRYNYCLLLLFLGVVCDDNFFTELEKETMEIVRCFRRKTRQLIYQHCSSGLQGYLRSMQSCFKSNKPVSVQEGMMLTDYITANAIAIRKLLKKYDKVFKLSLTDI